MNPLADIPSVCQAQKHNIRPASACQAISLPSYYPPCKKNLHKTQYPVIYKQQMTTSASAGDGAGCRKLFTQLGVQDITS